MVSQIVYMAEPGAGLGVPDLLGGVPPRAPMGQEVTRSDQNYRQLRRGPGSGTRSHLHSASGSTPVAVL